MTTTIPQVAPARPSKLTSILRGLRKRCPRCGVGHCLSGYLTVADTCEHCGERLGHIRADDGPAYFTILVAGHIVVPGSLWVEKHYAPPLVPFTLGALVVTALLIWLLLPCFKGAMVGLMWSLKLSGGEMHHDTASRD